MSGIRVYLTEKEALDLLEVLPGDVRFGRVCGKLLGALYASATFVGASEELEVEVRCGKCGAPMEAVRPGKWQCPKCEGKLEVMW